MCEIFLKLKPDRQKRGQALFFAFEMAILYNGIYEYTT